MGGRFFEAVDGGVLAEYVVADRSGKHGLQHGWGGPGDGVGDEIDFLHDLVSSGPGLGEGLQIGKVGTELTVAGDRSALQYIALRLIELG